MIPAIALAPPPNLPFKLNDLVRQLALDASLALIIDAGDSASAVNGTNQTLGVVPSGGVTVTRGPTSGADAGTRDPTLQGNVGGQSLAEYWRMDSAPTGGQGYFSSATGQATFNNLHKDNAAFTIALVANVGSAHNNVIFYDDCNDDPASVGITFSATLTGNVDGANHPNLQVARANAAFAVNATATTLTVLRDTIAFFALSVDEAAGTVTFAVNGKQETLTGKSYTSPSSAAATLGPLMSATANDITQSSDRLYNYALWNRALTAAELNTLYQGQQPKFGF